MKVIIKSNSDHVAQVANHLSLGNSLDATAENSESTLFEYEPNDLQVSFNEPDFAVNIADAEKRKSCAMDSFKAMLTPGEQLQSYRFGATTVKTGNLHAGCPVLEAKTNLAEYMVVYDDLMIADGTIKNNTIAYGNYKPKPMMFKNVVAMFLAKEFGKALAKGAAAEVFSFFFPEDKDAALKDEFKKMKNEIKQMFFETRYENLEDKLLQTRGWLRDIYSEKLRAHNNKQSLNMEEIRVDLKNRQEELHGVVEVLQQRISATELAGCDYFVRAKVMLFATCATLRIVLLKEQIFWQNAMLAEGNKNYGNDADLNELKNYVQRISKKLKEYVEDLKKGRLEKISTLAYTTHKALKNNKVAAIYKHWAVIKWTDTFESSNQSDPFKGGKIESLKKVNTDEKDHNLDQIKANTEKEYNDHLNAVKGLFDQYVASPLNDVINKLDTITYVIK
jgi:hypothetical protein